MNKKFNIEYILLSLILILGFVVRLYKINNPIADWHSWRQADTASVTRTYVESGINFLYPKYQDISSIQTGIFNPQGYRFVEFPFFNAIHAILYESYPKLSLEVWGRFLSVFCAVLSGLIIYLIGKRVIGKWGGLLSAFFFLFIPYNIYFTRVILPESFGVLFGLLGIFFYLKFIEKENNINLFISAFSFAVSMLIKPFFIFYLVPLIYLTINKYGIYFYKNRKLLYKLLLYGFVIFSPLVIWRGWVARYPEGIPFAKWAFNGDKIRFHPAFWRWIFGERLGNLILGIWGLPIFIFGVLKPKVKNMFSNYFLLGMFMYVVTVATASVRHDYYQILTVPAISIALASGVVFLWEGSIFNKIASRILVLFAIFMMLMIGWLNIKDNYNINHPEIIEAGKEVDKITPKDALVVAPYNGDTAFLYQTHRWGWPAIDDSIDHIIEKGADYYVSVDLGSSDTKMIELRFKTIEKTSRYIIIDLHQTIKTK